MIFALLSFCAPAGTTADLVPPFRPNSERAIGFWEIGGAAIIEENVIMLVPPIQYHKGCAWTNVEVPSGDWSIAFQMKIDQSNGGGGFGLWFVDKYGADGPMYGGPTSFKGLGIVATAVERARRPSLDLRVFQSKSREISVEEDEQDALASVPFTKGKPFEIKAEFQGTQLILKADDQEVARTTVLYNLAKRFMGITAANDRRVARFDLLSVVFDLNTSAVREELTQHGMSMGDDVPSGHFQPSYPEPLRKPSFNVTTLELKALEAKRGLQGKTLVTPESTIDRVFEVIDEMNSASYEVASFSELNGFIKNTILPFSQKWQKRTMNIVERVQNSRNVAGAAWNYTQNMIKIFKTELSQGSMKTSGKIVDLADLMAEVAENGIDESGEMKQFVNRVDKSKAMTFVIWVSLAEFVALVLFFIIVSTPCMKAKLAGTNHF